MNQIQDVKLSSSATPGKPSESSSAQRMDDIVIGLGVSTSGRFHTAGSVFVDGVLQDADVESSVLSVSYGGTFEGVANVHRAEIAGTLNGEAFATEEIVLRASAVVNGRLCAPYIVVHRGATVSGDVKSIERQGDGKTSTSSAPLGRRKSKRGVLLACLVVAGVAVSGSAVFALWA